MKDNQGRGLAIGLAAMLALAAVGAPALAQSGISEEFARSAKIADILASGDYVIVKRTKITGNVETVRHEVLAFEAFVARYGVESSFDRNFEGGATIQGDDGFETIIPTHPPPSSSNTTDFPPGTTVNYNSSVDFEGTRYTRDTTYERLSESSPDPWGMTKNVVTTKPTGGTECPPVCTDPV